MFWRQHISVGYMAIAWVQWEVGHCERRSIAWHVQNKGQEREVQMQKHGTMWLYVEPEVLTWTFGHATSAWTANTILHVLVTGACGGADGFAGEYWALLGHELSCQLLPIPRRFG